MRPMVPVSTLVLAAACSSHPPASTVVTTTTTEDLVVPLALAPALAAPEATPAPPEPDSPPGQVTHAIHNDLIRMLAATADGTAAVTADSIGVRLWPALDGDHEPVVVAMTTPTALALARDGDDLVIAGLDRDGAIELVRTAADGARRSRTMVASSHRYLAITAVPAGLLATRDDQALELVGFDGTTAAIATAPPATRIAAVVHHDTRAIVMLAAGVELRGRWLDVDAGLTWGDTTPVLKIDVSAGAALDPAHDVIAASAPDLQRVALVDLHTGQRTLRSATDYYNDPDYDLPLRPLGYVDGGLAVSDTARAMWNGGVEYVNAHATFDPTIATDRYVISAAGTGLELLDRHHRRFLGYQIGAVGQYLPVRGGAVIGDNFRLARIDDDFTAHAVHDDAAAGDGILIPIDRRHAVHVKYNYGTPDATLSWVDLDDDRYEPKTIEQIPVTYPAYSPATHLFAAAQNGTLWIAHLDTAEGTIDYEVQRSVDPYTEVVLTDPADTGAVAMLVDPPEGVTYAYTTVDRIVTPVVTVRPTGELELGKPHTVARDDVFWQRVADGAINNYGGSSAIRRASPDRTLIAELARKRITLRDAAGETRWTIPALDVTDLGWTRRGDLVAFGGGIERFDLTSGAVVTRQCGWQFGLWDAEPTPQTGQTMCDAETALVRTSKPELDWGEE